MSSIPNLSALSSTPISPEAVPTGVNADGSPDAQERLKRDGVVVIKTALANPDTRAATRAGFYRHIRESPEFLNPTPEDPQWKPSLVSSEHRISHKTADNQTNEQAGKRK